MPSSSCIPATIDLAGAEIELVSMVAREGRLYRALEQLDTSKFDYVLIDCPPSLGLLTVNALVAAEEVLIPIQCEYYALEGLSSCCAPSSWSRAPEPRSEDHDDPAHHVRRPHPARNPGRRRRSRALPRLVLHTIIPRSVRVSEAPVRPVRDHLRPFFFRRGRLPRSGARARLPGRYGLSSAGAPGWRGR